MKHDQFFRDFLANHVNLNPARLERLDGHVNAVSDYLADNLTGYQGVERQGSYALGTITRPVQEAQEYDADLLLLMEYRLDWEAPDYIDGVRACLRGHTRYREIARRKTRCVTLDYAGDVHLDIVPCISFNGTQYICNSETGKFEPTDGTGYRDWFNDRNRETGGNLKRVTRLLKYMRDHKGNFTAPSVLLTTLIGNTVDGTGEFDSVPDALHTVMSRIDSFLQAHPRMPFIANPALPEEDFTRKWDQRKYAHFREMFHTYALRVGDAYAEHDHNKSVRKWRAVFGDDFGELREATAKSRAVRPQRPWAR
ncbi:MAG: hypothetical protein OXI50_02120 [Gammaproteobacteria bacterium]|nr:hypothetical protein [Gammaproteobacteria bacterium]